MPIAEIDSSYFDWTLWRNGSPLDMFGFHCRTDFLIAHKSILREYAVGWCNACRLLVRPKMNAVAVMFFKDDKYFWFHFRDYEFKAVFGDSAS